MAVLTPAYRLRIYAPRSVDSTEQQLLTPAAGAPHAEAFQVATIPGVTGYRPYLFPPEGRRGSFDPLTKRVDTGEMTFAVFDKRTATGDNAERWLTAFAGDAEGRPWLLNCRVEADESLDGGDTWDPFFAGRVQAFAFDHVLIGTLTVREESELFDTICFVGRPHASVTYARTQAVLPVQPPPPPGAGYRTIAGTAEGLTAFGSWSIVVAGSATKYLGNVVSEGMTALATRAGEQWFTEFVGGPKKRGYRMTFGTLSETDGVTTLAGSKLRALVYWAGGGYGEYPVSAVMSAGKDDFFRATYLFLREYPVGASGAAARPAAATPVTVVLVADAEASAATPIILEDANPLTVFEDALAGRFSRLNTDGTVRRTLAADTAAFTALAAARSFLPINAVIDKPLELRAFLEDYILKPNHIGYRVSPSGAITPFDVRRDSSLASVASLGIADVASVDEGFGWTQQRGDAVSNIRVEAFRDRVPDIEDLVSEGGGPILRSAAGTLEPAPFTIIDADLSPRALDVTGRELEIKAPGWRAREEGSGGTGRGGDPTAATYKQDEAIMAAAIALVTQLRALYGGGGSTVSRAFRRAQAGDVLPGMWRRLTLPEAPNAASYLRGGERLGICIDRVERGAIVDLTFLDGGASSVAVVPVLSSLALASTAAPQVTVTRNAAGDPVLLEIALTAQSVGTAPTTGWTDGGVARVDGAFTLPMAPAAMRLWVRGRSEPESAGDDFRLPSAFVAPSPAFLDTGTVTAPSGVSVGTIGRTVATVSWTNGEATAPIEILLTTGSFSAGVFDAPGLVIATLPAGSTSYRLVGLDGPSAAHCVGVRHLVPETGRFSAIASADFSTSTTDPQLARPAGIYIIAPQS